MAKVSHSNPYFESGVGAFCTGCGAFLCSYEVGDGECIVRAR